LVENGHALWNMLVYHNSQSQVIKHSVKHDW